MSQALIPLTFPLHGSRLIEASAGTGKTWTIAALYVRLVLGHGGEHAYARALLPSEILVMTFTRAATRELSHRVRERLTQAAASFRGEHPLDDPFLAKLAAAYPDEHSRSVAAHRLAMAADAMDEAAIFTIDGWCNRMLGEHAFDSGSRFDEELISDETSLFEDAAHDYWRQHVYALDADTLRSMQAGWKDVAAMKDSVRELRKRVELLEGVGREPLGALVARAERERPQALSRLKAEWCDRADAMCAWIETERAAQPKAFDGKKLRKGTLDGWFDQVRTWASDPELIMPGLTDSAWHRLSPAGMAEAINPGFGVELPDHFAALAALKSATRYFDPVRQAMLQHAAVHIADRIQELKQQRRQSGFTDMLDRLRDALENDADGALRRRIAGRFPVAMVDEFQDTSPTQYRVFDLLYRVAANDADTGLFLIGDPKQSIYGFRGADIHSYLAARRATEGRHYQLGKNFRSTGELVAAVNRVFMHAEGDAGAHGYPKGAFGFRRPHDNPLPFEPVAANGLRERMVGVDDSWRPLTVCSTGADDMNVEAYRDFFAQHCAEHIVGQLNDPGVGFEDGRGFRRLDPADIAVLVRNQQEADAVRRALARRGVLSVYLSDRDTVVDSDEAADVLRWMQAVASPLDGALARVAFATRTAGLPLAELAALSTDELGWERRVEQLKALHVSWQRQGVLAMLRALIHELGVPKRLLGEQGGERRLTNLLHLAELLQEASVQLEGEQALVRWLAEQIEGVGEGGDERILRLESDAELVKVITVYKSKGLEYPLVYLPFAVSVRSVERHRVDFLEYVDGAGKRRVDLTLGDDALAAVLAARLEEDLRLLYVALTRARHFLWLGVAALPAKKDHNRLHESGFGYLLTGGDEVPAGALGELLARLRGDLDAIGLCELSEPGVVTPLQREESHPVLDGARPYSADFERDWSVGSFTSMTRHALAAPVPMRAQEQTLLEEAPQVLTPARIEDAPWHRFPRGSMPGNFLHEQLEWLARESFDCLDDPDCEARMVKDITRRGWDNHLGDTLAWLRAIVDTPLPPLNAALRDLKGVLPEMEFWFPSEHLDLKRLDRLCRTRLMKGIERPTLPDRVLHGMLKGFADLVFEHEGRYWVLDYKSNALGPGDAAYTRPAMEVGMAEHRYEIQGSIYLLALHRLLRARLGDAYEPEYQLGGAVFMFLRGIANPDTRGCCVLAPDLELLDELERLLDKEEHAEG